MRSSGYISNFFIDMARYDENETITNMRINKLMYYAQAWSLVQSKKPLFEEDFEAWDYGPVLPSVYKKYKKYKKNNIDKVDPDYSVNDLSTDDLKVLLSAYTYFNQYSTTRLVNATHQKGSPWYTAYTRRKSSTITKDSISSSFTVPDADVTHFHVSYCYDPETKDWLAVGKDIDGLVAEEETLNKLIKECYLAADDLLDSTGNMPFIIDFDEVSNLEDD